MIHRETSRDPVIESAIRRHHGLRIVSQDPWECLISYLCAQNAHIPFIRRMVGSIAKSCGIPAEGGGPGDFAFPSPERLAGISDEEFDSCVLGYRAPYIRDAAWRVAETPGWADALMKMEYEEARRELLTFRGVGPKVADCVLLFGFRKFESFPVDVWIARIMREKYLHEDPALPLTPAAYERIRRFGQEYFGAYAGYAQEYLFADRC